MKLTKERVIILILSVLLLATAIAAVCFCHHVSSVYHSEKAEWEATEADIREATKSEEVFRDGLWVEATVYLTDFELDKENGRLNFVIKNKGSNTCIENGIVLIQFRENGEWKLIPSYSSGEFRHDDIDFYIGSFRQFSYSSDFPAEEQLPGEYRVLHTQSFGYTGHPAVYAVGYFNIP